MQIFTLITSSMTIEPIPNNASEGLRSVNFVITNLIVGRKFELVGDPCSPKSPCKVYMPFS